MAEPCTIIESEVVAGGAALMGIVNTTPDSFYDGGKYAEPRSAEVHVDALVEEGALIVDVGGESSRPGAAAVSPEEQIRRIRPALEHAVSRAALVSVDTTSPEVARFALERGARIVNDVSCLRDPGLARAAAEHDAVLIITHSRGPMSGMKDFSKWPEADYGDVVHDVLVEWGAARDRAISLGVRRENVWLDPGLGFSKSARHSLELLARLDELQSGKTIIVVGPSRKSFISAAHPAPPEDRLGGTIAACLVAVARGAHVLRVHDVREVRQGLALARATARPTSRQASHAR